MFASLLFPAIWLLLFACEKETPPTVINGKVTDRKTGMPVEGAGIDIDFQTEKNVGGSLKTDHEYVSFSTDINGEFFYTHNSDFTRTYSVLQKTGYIRQEQLTIIKGEINDLDIKLAPYDGVLRLIIKNEAGLFDSIYVNIENPSRVSGLGEYFGSIRLDQFPLYLSVGEQYTTHFNLTSEEFTKIQWGFTHFTLGSDAPFSDSVFLLLNDTTMYNLIY